jgi:hypothetical protein
MRRSSRKMSVPGEADGETIRPTCIRTTRTSDLQGAPTKCSLVFVEMELKEPTN